MKKILVIGVFLLLTFWILPVYAETTQITVNFNQAQFQWRGSVLFGDWSHTYQNSLVDSAYVLSGETLHTAWDYSPPVENETGASTVYKYDKKSGFWIEKEGQVHYQYLAGYGDYIAVNYFRGYLDFGGETPGDETFIHGVAYQWVYVLAPRKAELPGAGLYTDHAVWDNRVNAWLVGFSIYLWDKGSQDYSPTGIPVPFPGEDFPEPVPANDYNPLGY